MLDVRLNGPLNRKPLKILATLKELSNGTVASWLGPSLNAVFTERNIEKAFLSTGFWDENLNYIYVEKETSQYEPMFNPLPNELRKMNKPQRRKESILRGAQAPKELCNKEASKAESTGLVVGGHNFAKIMIAGNLASTANLGQVLNKHAKLIQIYEETHTD